MQIAERERERKRECLPRWVVSPRSEEHRTVSSKFMGYHMARKTGPFMSTHHVCR